MSIKCRAAILVEPNKPLVVDEVELPDPEPDQVWVKLFASGVCHSQLHTMRRPPRPGHRLPALLGHESTGLVVAKGRDVTHVREGDHVITTCSCIVFTEHFRQMSPKCLHESEFALRNRAQP